MGGWRMLASVMLAATAAAAFAGVGVTGGSSAQASGPVPVVVIVMENAQYKNIIGNANAPFVNKTMISHGLLDANYLADVGSLPDYLEMVSGQLAPPPSAPNLFAALGTSVPWREFMESMPSTCYKGANYHVVTGTNWGLYTRYHNAALQFTSVSTTPLCKNVVPLTGTYFKPWALPVFSYVVPNECDDMHTLPTNHQCPMWNGSVNKASNLLKMGDNWLASFVPAVARHATVVLTWDEGSPSNEQVVTVLYGLGVTPGVDGAPYSHASLEAGLYARLGVGPAPGDGATATPLPIP